MKPGAYEVTVQAFVQIRVESPADFRREFSFILLRSAPAPDGTGRHELIAPDYFPHPVTLAAFNPRGGRLLQSSGGVVFANVSSWSTATHGALVDAHDRMIGAGRLNTSAGYADADTLTFAASAIQLDLRTSSPDARK